MLDKKIEAFYKAFADSGSFEWVRGEKKAIF
jgi:hypothetical protein